MLWFNQGWESYSKAILRLITSSRLPGQLSSFCHIVICLIQYQCIEGAYSVANQIFSSLSSDFKLVKTFNQSQIVSYFDTMVAVETSGVVTILKKWVLPFFCHMNSNQQFQLLFDLEQNRNSRLKNYPSCVELFNIMALHVVGRLESKSSSLSPERIHELAYFFLLQQNDYEIRFTFLLFGFYKASKEFSFAIFEIASSSVAVKTILFNFLKFHYVVLEKPAFSQLLSVEDVSLITKKPLDAFLVLVQFEQKLELTENDSILAGLDPLYQQMPVNRLANLVIDLMTYRGSHPALSSRWGLAMFVRMGKCLVNQESSAFESGPPFDALLKLLKYFADLPDQSTPLTHFIMDICRTDRPHSLFKKLIASEEVRLMAESYPFVRSSLCSLLNDRLQIVKESIAKEVSLAWQIPNVSLPGHPVVEDFLRSPNQQMHYANFSSKEQALLFSSQLSSLIDSVSGYSIRVGIFGEGFNCRCDLTKVCSIRNNKVETLLNEKNLFEEKLGAFENHKKRKSPDESSVCPTPKIQNDRDDNNIIELPVKKIKPEIIDLD